MLGFLFFSSLQECLLDKHHHVAVALGKPEGSASNVSPADTVIVSDSLNQQSALSSHGTLLDFTTANSSLFTQDAGNSSEATPPTFTLLSFSELVSGSKPLSDEDPAYWESFQSKQDGPVRQSDAQ